MTTLYCDICGASVDRSEDNTLRHKWDDPYGNGSNHVGLMIGYHCDNRTAKHPGHWGKLRVVVVAKQSVEVPA